MALIPTKISFTHLHTVAFIFFLTILLSKSVGSNQLRHGGDQRSDREETMTSKKLVLGSRPPGCMNKCLNCRPCTATLVIPSHQKKRLDRTYSHGDEDDSYYLLSWKCRCGNKLFHP